MSHLETNSCQLPDTLKEQQVKKHCLKALKIEVNVEALPSVTVEA